MRRPVFFIAFCLVILISGIYYGGLGRRISGPPDSSTISVVGIVCQKDDTSFLVKIKDFNCSENATVLWCKNSKLTCEYENAKEVMIGSKVWLVGEYFAYSKATNPGEFDYKKYYHSTGCMGRIRNAEIRKCRKPYFAIREWLYQCKVRWERRLYEVYPKKEASVMAAMLLGEKADLNQEIKELYAQNGIIHILSISGLHITLLGMGLYKRLRKLGVPTWLAAGMGSALLLLYGAMTGFGVSACRAIGMYLLRMLAQILGRTYDMLTALGVMAVVLICMQPWLAGNMGFLLSFASILGVGIVYPSLNRGEKNRMAPTKYVENVWLQKSLTGVQTFFEYLKSSALAGGAILITTLPIQLWFQYEVPVYSVILNLFVLPFVGVLVVTGLIVMLIPYTGLLGTIDIVILQGYESLCRLFEQLPHPMWNPGQPRVWQMILYYAGLVLLVGWGQLADKKRKKLTAQIPILRKERVVKTAGVVGLILLMGIPQMPLDEVTFLDVGQGDGICVQLATGEVYLFDCGSSNRKGIGEKVLIPYLKWQGITKIDAIFLSHDDADHINGIVELLEQCDKEHLSIGQLVLPQMENGDDGVEFQEILTVAKSGRPEIPVTRICTGMFWKCGGASFLCLNPDGNGGLQGNASSACFLAEFANGMTLLLTGDVEGEGEQELVRQLQARNISQVDLLKCAHHGSKGTTGADFLKQVKPVYTIISCGRNNRYGHPHAETLERLQTCGSEVLRTDLQGAITVTIDRKAKQFEGAQSETGVNGFSQNTPRYRITYFVK